MLPYMELKGKKIKICLTSQKIVIGIVDNVIYTDDGNYIIIRSEAYNIENIEAIEEV